MRNLFTFLALLICIFGNAQSGIIQVNIEDACGDTFEKPVTIDLYKLEGLNEVLLSSSTSNPSTFDGLDESLDYVVKVNSSDQVDAYLGLLDLVAMRNIILGIYPYEIPAVIAGDLNNTNGASTLDLVFMQRDMIGILDYDLTDWFYIDQAEQFPLPLDISSFLNKTQVTSFVNGSADITFVAYHEGKVANALGLDCTSCAVDSGSTMSIQFPNIELAAGETVDIPLYVNKTTFDYGVSFSLNYQNGFIIDVKGENGSMFKRIDNQNQINVLNFFQTSVINPAYKILTITLQASQAGPASSFFSINNNYPTEAIYQAADCIKNYESIGISELAECPIVWPVSPFTVPSCDKAYYAGEPIIDASCKDIIGVTYTDQVIGAPCTTIIRSWTALNWLTEEFYYYTQIINVDEDYPTICLDGYVIIDQGATLYARDLVDDALPNHIYSFTNNDPTDTTIYLIYSPPYTESFVIYDIIDQTSCVTRITKLSCNGNEPVHVKNAISVAATSGQFVVKGSYFDGGNVNHCLGQISEFEIAEVNSNNYFATISYDYNSLAGTTRSYKLRYKLNGVIVEHGTVQASFLPGNYAPFEISCFDDPVTKDVPYEIAFFSSTFENIYGLQGAFRIDNAIIVSSKVGELENITFNQDLHTLRFVWVYPNGVPVTLTQDDTLFTITILPTKSGSMSELITLADDLLGSEAVLDDLTNTKLDLVFNFLKRTTSSTNISSESKTTIYPNPNNGDMLHVRSSDLGDMNISFMTEEGRIVSSGRYHNSDGDVSVSMPNSFANGMYLVRIEGAKEIVMKKLFVIR